MSNRHLTDARDRFDEGGIGDGPFDSLLAWAEGCESRVIALEAARPTLVIQDGVPCPCCAEMQPCADGCACKRDVDPNEKAHRDVPKVRAAVSLPASAPVGGEPLPTVETAMTVAAAWVGTCAAYAAAPAVHGASIEVDEARHRKHLHVLVTTLHRAAAEARRLCANQQRANHLMAVAHDSDVKMLTRDRDAFAETARVAREECARLEIGWAQAVAAAALTVKP